MPEISNGEHENNFTAHGYPHQQHMLCRRYHRERIRWPRKVRRRSRSHLHSQFGPHELYLAPQMFVIMTFLVLYTRVQKTFLETRVARERLSRKAQPWPGAQGLASQSSTATAMPTKACSSHGRWSHLRTFLFVLCG